MDAFAKIKLGRAQVFLLILIVLALVGFAFDFWYSLGDNRGYAPEQPIPFSHRRHAGQYKIDCQYCHFSADKSRHAGIPSMQLCLNCHSVVKGDSPHIQKLKQLVAEGKPFEWVKVHDMPDFVVFNHKPHIAKGFDCSVCHGDLRNMDRVKQVQRLNMGFCLECHQKNGAPTNCNTCHN